MSTPAEALARPAPRPTLRARLATLNGWLLVALCFALPTHAAPVYLLAALMLGVWLAQPGLGARAREVARLPVVWAFLAYYLVFALSLAWTADLDWGWRMVGRQAPFLLFPLILTVALHTDPRRALDAYLAALALSVLLAAYNHLQLHAFPHWPEGIRVAKSPEDTAPFVDRIMYAPLLALGGYLAAYRFLFPAAGAHAPRWLWGALWGAISANLFLSGGRAGILAYLGLLTLLAVQRWPRHPVRALGAGLAVVTALSAGAYAGSDYFRERVHSAVSEARHAREAVNTSVGLRINFAANSWRMFAEHPLTGVGVGDFPAEYERINQRESPHALPTTNPHNQLLWVLSTTGALGGAVLLWLLHSTLAACQGATAARHLIVALWTCYAIAGMFESYLWRSNTALAFVVMAAVAGALASRPLALLTPYYAPRP